MLIQICVLVILGMSNSDETVGRKILVKYLNPSGKFPQLSKIIFLLILDPEKSSFQIVKSLLQTSLNISIVETTRNLTFHNRVTITAPEWASARQRCCPISSSKGILAAKCLSITWAGDRLKCSASSRESLSHPHLLCFGSCSDWSERVQTGSLL